MSNNLLERGPDTLNAEEFADGYTPKRLADGVSTVNYDELRLTTDYGHARYSDSVALGGLIKSLFRRKANK